MVWELVAVAVNLINSLNEYRIIIVLWTFVECWLSVVIAVQYFKVYSIHLYNSVCLA